MTTASLTLYDRTIRYAIKTSDRAQRLRLAVYADGSVVVTKPVLTSGADVKKFVEYKKEWIERKLEFNHTLPIPELRTTSQRHFLAHKNQAQQLVEGKVLPWSKKLRVIYHQVAVKRLKARWGSCSGNGNLSFNYKILFLPPDLQDYLIVHELCHLKEMNHSPKFWKWVASAMPHYADLKKMIRNI